MAQMSSILIVIALLGVVLEVVRASTLYPCDPSGYHDVEDNTPVTFYCDKYSRSVTWGYRPPSEKSFSDTSTCNMTMCETITGAMTFNTTFISAGNSSLTSTLTSRKLTQAGGEYRCDKDSCKIHIIEPAVISKPTSTISQNGKGYFVQCSTNIRTIYSSRGQYSCVWRVGTEHLNGTLNLKPTPSDTNNTSNRTGSCNVTVSLPKKTGVYMCNVAVLPGKTRNSSDSFKIDRPLPPKINCRPFPVPENSTVTCTCNTNSLGQPEGRLTWYMGTNGVFDRSNFSGDSNATNLIMTWLVTRSDHNVTTFRCVNEWIVNITALNDYTVIVGENTYEPGINITVLAGGIAGGVVVIIVIAIIIVCVIKRRQKGHQKSPPVRSQDGGRRARERDRDNGTMHVNSCYESSESTSGQVPESSYDYVQTPKYAEEDYTSDEYAHIRRDR